ncbi:MAG: DNA-deoxyinosine glycosylase [Christensenellaceae bacterium]
MSEKELRKAGFEPVFDKESRLLVLGSFPSVKSRKIQFYYGNKQNRFWKTVCNFFGEEIPESTEGKKEFLYRRKIALWDMVTECEIEGSADSAVKNASVADLGVILKAASIEKILLNGTLSYNLFTARYADLAVPYFKMPSTSPANPRFDAEIWKEQLRDLL